MSQSSSLQGPGKPPGVFPPITPPVSRKSKAVACAECRRLKLKCDRDFPCLNCRRREVAALCPNASLITRSRPSPSGSVPIEGTPRGNDVAWMSQRIKKLEEALALVQAKVSDEPHPLLLESSHMNIIPEHPNNPNVNNNQTTHLTMPE